MRLVISHKDGTVETVEAVHSATLSYRVGGISDTFDQGQLTALHLDSIESLEVSGHAEAPKPEVPFKTEQVEQSAADFWMGKSNAHFATDKAQESRVVLTMRKPTKGTK
jgi:hypothetical protein